ncbi:MAG: TlpA disulfide reductase family protein [Chlorobiaceae bacterium]
MAKRIGSFFKAMATGAIFLGGVTIIPVATSAAESVSAAPLFSAVALDGKSVSSANLAGKAYIINFFASWCPPCRSEIPDMVALQTKYGRKGFTFIGVAVNENEQTIKAFMKNNRISYPVVMADPQIIGAFSRYVDGGIRSIPTSFVVSPSGKITQIITGSRSKDVFEQLIQEALRRPGKAK